MDTGIAILIIGLLIVLGIFALTVVSSGGSSTGASGYAPQTQYSGGGCGI